MDEKIIRIGNCSGFYGDKLSAAKEMVEGGPIDVLTGDYLAELTMAILFSQKMQRGEKAGYVGTFMKQLKEIANTCAEKNIKIVSNAGGLNPKSMAEDIEEMLKAMNLDLKVAYIDGDDLMPRLDELKSSGEKLNNIDTGEGFFEQNMPPLSANAYLGCWAIKEALDQGADIVIWGTNPVKNIEAELMLRRRHPRRVLTQIVNVAEEEGVNQAFDQAVAHMGRIDAVFANAAAAKSERTTVSWCPETKKRLTTVANVACGAFFARLRSEGVERDQHYAILFWSVAP